MSIWNTRKIKKTRRDLEITVKDAAAVFGITDVYLYMIESGAKQPGTKLIIKMAELYKKPISFFMNEETAENHSFV